MNEKEKIIYFYYNIRPMKNLKLLSFALLCGILVIAWCEKANNPEQVACEGDEVCPVETNVDTPSQEVEETPSDVVDEWNLEWDLTSYEWWEDVVLDGDTQSADEPMMRKMVVDENATPEEIEQDMIETCGNAGWNWADWVCTLEDGSVIAF